VREPLVRRAVGLVGVVVVTATAFVAAQEKPNFSGIWTGARATRELGPAQHWAQGQPVTITQDADSITFAYVSNGRSHSAVRLSYRLDGTPTTNTSPQGPLPPQARRSQITSTAKWEGTDLVLITVYETPNPATGVVDREEVRERLTFETPARFRLETSQARYAATSLAHFTRQADGRP